MKESIRHKLEDLTSRYEELQGLLASEEIINNQEQFRTFSQEYAQIEPVIQQFSAYQKAIDDIETAKEMMAENDPEMKALAQEEIKVAQQTSDTIYQELQKLLIPKDPLDDSNIFLEIRAGTGGDEAAIFAGDLYRMYARYAENRGWQVEIMNENSGEHGGYKEIIVRLIGYGAYSRLKFESGAHRVQRVPDTETQGRVHTSAATVAIMAEVTEVNDIQINEGDLRIDTFRASGAGGQHVNRTDSAVRITHIPTGTVVECQEERSQIKNKAKAMSVLKARLLQAEQDKQQAEQAATRKSLVGSGDRSERIRTYNFPQGRVTDHRINLTLYKIEEIMQGDLDQVIEPLLQEHQTAQLAALGA